MSRFVGGAGGGAGGGWRARLAAKQAASGGSDKGKGGVSSDTPAYAGPPPAPLARELDRLEKEEQEAAVREAARMAAGVPPNSASCPAYQPRAAIKPKHGAVATPGGAVSRKTRR